MDGIAYSNHAGRRMQQRGIRERDIDLLLACGTQIDGASILLSDKDAAREIERRKHDIQALERLRGCKVAISDGVVVTCYHARAKHLKKALRRRR
ncbi:MAG: DUF4258 domain-containing protein [Alphaproteobacteria bacterium]|jgi:hypothetical protein|nr:DUF4258 domain-containing protein [Alphaproteobacteria bacterium]MDP6818021.1 DUF4258 domain-containing protein [Alphaproteobacteria bacterium]|tara:strand:- start:1854 stop:2138 length:285 start_codon:yes stop_codon:yes gene_type:complete